VHVAQAYYAPYESEPIPQPPKQAQKSLCNCYAYLKGRNPTLPLQSALKRNSTPIVGAIALFEYPQDDGSLLPHVAEVISLEETGFWVIENNYTPCETAKRFVLWSDIRLKGFHSLAPLTVEVVGEP
jgi:hypothetical protein